MAGVLLPLGLLLIVLAVAAALALAIVTRNELKQLRSELDETQRQLNDTRRELNELRAAAEAPPVVAPPPLPRSRSAKLDDLREQLRAAHREETRSEE
jgi:DNA repair exonuclease SbcCD ATPase subunit